MPASAGASKPQARASWTAPRCHEDLFVDRYQTLRRRALRLAGNQTDADDLLHDAFVQFVLRRRDLGEINDLDAYLFGMLRRLQLSRRRAALRAREQSLLVIDYDTAALSLQATDARDALRVREELGHVCAYACQRKHTSRSGSVLLLRFFHGFFPGEIAGILRCPLRGANDWLRIARREARAYSIDPAQARRDASATRPDGHDDEDTDALRVLQEMIWRSRRDACISEDTLERTYRDWSTETLSCRQLAHVVSCRECLGRVTVLLGMRRPSDRDPHDTLRQDTSWRALRPRGSDAPQIRPQLRRWQRSVQEIQAHVPQELHVAANGLPLGTCTIGGSACTFTLVVKIDEPLDFIEVFSEQGVRLFLWAIDAVPSGDVDQSDRIELGGDRSLGLALHFDRAWPSLEITYEDASWNVEGDAIVRGTTASVLPFLSANDDRAVDGGESLWRQWLERWSAFAAGYRFGRPVLRPALAALLIVAGLLLWARTPWRTEPLSAAQILSDARSFETRLTSAPGLVTHRVIQMEERRLPDRVVLRRRRIEGWRSAHRQVEARRVFDERGDLIGGEWVRSDGARTVYMVGHSPRFGERVFASDDLWRWEPSVGDFEYVLGQEQATVRDEGSQFVLTHRPSLPHDGDGLVEARLIVTKQPLRPIAQTLILRERGVLKEFQFTETTRAQLPQGSVSDTLFDPEPELLGSATVANPVPVLPPPVRRLATRSVVSPQAVNRVEVDLLYTLHRFERCLDVPAAITSINGNIAATVTLASPGCANKISEAVRAVQNGDDAVSITVTQARRAIEGSPSPVRPVLDTVPAYQHLIRRFAAAGLSSSSRAEQDSETTIAARAFGAWALEHSQRALDEMRHLQAITERWDLEALASLDVDQVARWQDVVRDHARRFRRETEGLRLQLRSLLTEREVDEGEGVEVPLAVRGVSEMRPAVERLLTEAATQHDATRQLFDLGLTTARVPIDLRALYTALQNAEAQASCFDEPWTIPDH